MPFLRWLFIQLHRSSGLVESSVENKRVGALIHGLHEKTGTQWPMVYRIHDEPDLEKLASLQSIVSKFGYTNKIDLHNKKSIIRD